MSRLCGEIDGKIQGFLDRPLEGDWPYLWLDATYLKVREAGRIVSVAVTVAVAVNDQGRREVLGMATGASEAETFWTEFLRGLARRGLRGLKLVIRFPLPTSSVAACSPDKKIALGWNRKPESISTGTTRYRTPRLASTPFW